MTRTLRTVLLPSLIAAAIGCGGGGGGGDGSAPSGATPEAKRWRESEVLPWGFGIDYQLASSASGRHFDSAGLRWIGNPGLARMAGEWGFGTHLSSAYPRHRMEPIAIVCGEDFHRWIPREHELERHGSGGLEPRAWERPRCLRQATRSAIRLATDGNRGGIVGQSASDGS